MGYYEGKMWEKFRETKMYQEYVWKAGLEDSEMEKVYFEFWKEGYEEGAEAGEHDAWDEAYSTGYKRPRED